MSGIGIFGGLTAVFVTCFLRRGGGKVMTSILAGWASALAVNLIFEVAKHGL